MIRLDFPPLKPLTDYGCSRYLTLARRFVTELAMASTDRTTNPATGDSGPGTRVSDLLPTPATNPNDISPAQGVNGQTLSHALATDDHNLKGHAQLDHEKEVQDLGWNEKKEDVAAPLVGGMDNEELWMLVRRFDKASKPPLPTLPT